ncbi:MAG: YlxR family protein [Clostridiales bacterium]|nr:YlxR family protein [Clostridiales bacterium]
MGTGTKGKSKTPPKKKIPERKCTGCGEKRIKFDLYRIVRSPDGTVSLDTTGKKSGRGAYICKNVSCLKKARKAQRLERNLECEIPDSVYDTLEEELAEHEQ